MTPSETIEIRYSPIAMGGLVFIGLLLMIFSAAVAFRLLPTVQPGSFQEAAGWFGLIVFALMTALSAWRMGTTKGPVVTLTPTGLRDIRVAESEIPWTAIRTVTTKRIKRTKFLVLAIDPAIEPGLKLTRMARWSRPMNRRYGVEGLCIAAQGLAITHGRLEGLCEERLAASRNR